MAFQFDDETALTGGDGHVWHTSLTSNWNIGENPNGGYLLAPLLRAMGSVSGHPDPLSVTTHFLRPGAGDAPATVEVEPLRVGRTIGTVRGRMVQQDRSRIEAIAAFTDSSRTDGVVDLAVPPFDLPPPDECRSRAQLEQGVELPIMQRLDVRVHPDMAIGGESATAEIAGWIRFADHRPVDAFALALFADAFPPSLFSLLGHVGWVPTIELTVQVRRRPVVGWIRGHFFTRDAVGDRLIEDGMLWDESGALVAQSRQVGLVLPT